jgi:hypothetical protein
MFTTFTTCTLGLMRANLFLVHSFRHGGSVGDGVLFFCTDLAGLDRVRGDAAHVGTEHIVDPAGETYPLFFRLRFSFLFRHAERPTSIN